MYPSVLAYKTSWRVSLQFLTRYYSNSVLSVVRLLLGRFTKKGFKIFHLQESVRLLTHWWHFTFLNRLKQVHSIATRVEARAPSPYVWLYSWKYHATIVALLFNPAPGFYPVTKIRPNNSHDTHWHHRTAPLPLANSLKRFRCSERGSFLRFPTCNQ